MTRIFAHRGYSAAYPENTELAFREAVKTGCHGIELDVQLTKDGEIVVIHDETVDRTTDGTGRVRDATLEQLRRLDASAGFAGKYGRNRIPTIGEYFDIVEGSDIITNIELKNGIFTYPGLAGRIALAVLERGMSGRVIFSSFNHQALLECGRRSPGSGIAFIESSWLIGAGAYCAANGADYLNPRHAFLTEENMAELKAHGIRAQAWTVDDPGETRRLLALGVDSIITNDPVSAMRLGGYGSSAPRDRLPVQHA